MIGKKRTGLKMSLIICKHSSHSTHYQKWLACNCFWNCIWDRNKLQERSNNYLWWIKISESLSSLGTSSSHWFPGAISPWNYNMSFGQIPHGRRRCVCIVFRPATRHGCIIALRNQNKPARSWGRKEVSLPKQNLGSLKIRFLQQCSGISRESWTSIFFKSVEL